MGWFDILKLSGSDLNGDRYQNIGNEDPKHDYDDHEESGRVADYFYNLKNTATTRPHFEYQAKKPKMKGIPIAGNLKEIVDGLDIVGSGKYFSFTDKDDDSYVITYEKKKITDPYVKTFTGLTPERLDNESSVVVFDSVYPTNHVEKLRSRGTTFKEIWPNDKERLDAFNITPEKRQELIQLRNELNIRADKHRKKLNNRKLKGQARQDVISTIEMAEKEAKEITTKLGSGRNIQPKRRRRKKRW
tara:strand:+ start:49 stop:783 length:735 start_codon:yes stop_codon:yes gene_type:complete